MSGKLGLSRQTRQDGQTGAHQHQWQLALLHLVHGHDERAEFLFGKILDLVNHDGQARFAFHSRFRHNGKEIRQVYFQVATDRFIQQYTCVYLCIPMYSVKLIDSGRFSSKQS